MEMGVVFGRDMLGYDVRDGKMTINSEGAKIVRLIFDKFVNEGKGAHTIARELREAGIESYRQNQEWSNTAILRVLKNEKYCGDLVQKKTYTPDYLSHDKKYNRGQEDFVILKDHHEAIVSREMFEEATRIMDSKALSQEGKAKHSNRYAFSGKIKCGVCGNTYVARYRTRKDGSRDKAWRCFQSTQNGSPHIDAAGNHLGYSNNSIRDEVALYIMQLAVSSLDFDRDLIHKNLMDAIEKVISNDIAEPDTEKLTVKIKEAEEKRVRLLDIYMSGGIGRDEFVAARAKCDAEIETFQSTIEGIQQQDLLLRERQNLRADIEDAVEEMLSGQSRDDNFYRNILNRMVVQDKNHIDVYLNLLPFRWSYAIEKAGEISQTRNCTISDHDMDTHELSQFSKTKRLFLATMYYPKIQWSRYPQTQ